MQISGIATREKTMTPTSCLYSRPWMKEHGAASVTPGAGVKGIIAGGITGMIQILITYPTEYIKTQLQLDEKGSSRLYNGSVDCIKQTLRSRGVFGLYRGLSVLLIGTVPQNAVRFGAFEGLRKRGLNEEGNLTPGWRVMCGLGAGVAEAVFVVTPMDTIKVKMINDQRSDSPRYRGLVHGVGLIVREQGVQGVYKGLVATVVKQGSNQAIRFYVMETCKDWYRGGDATKHVPTPLVGAFGVVAGVASVLGNSPVDVVKTRMQGLEASKYTSTADCFVKIWRKEGPLAFYKGVGPRMVKVSLDVPLTFMLYDSIMELMDKVWPK